MKKIMFNDKYGLTKAVLEGRKTMTRRIIPVDETRGGLVPISFWNGKWEGAHGRPLKSQPYKIGEVVAVAQAYKDTFGNPDFLFGHKPGWSNKMFVSADLMPHQIRITNVRVERLQDISDEDCYREGIYKKTLSPPGDIDYFYHSEPRSKWDVYPSAIEAFKGLIDKVSGKGTWESNPWVFVYEFELVK